MVGTTSRVAEKFPILHKRLSRCAREHAMHADTGSYAPNSELSASAASPSTIQAT
jgi:hypothetical protein